MQLFLKPKIEPRAAAATRTAEVVLGPSDAAGRPLGELIGRLPAGVRVVAMRVGHENKLPDPEHVLQAGDVLMLGSTDGPALQAAQAMLGEVAWGRIASDRCHLDYLRVFVSKRPVVGLRLSDVKFPKGVEAAIVQVWRGDTELVLAPDLILEFGDRVGLFASRDQFSAIRKHFGDSIRSTAEFSYISLGLGMVLGVLLGIVPIPVPGLGTLKVGLAGGPLLVALILGKLGRTGKMTWTMPLSANITLRNFGLSIFLAQVGMSAGPMFMKVIQKTGLTYVFLGALVLFALALTALLVGHFLMRIPFDDLMGITSGVTGNPAIVAYASRAVPSERVEICYAMIYPTATILKILIAQLIIAFGVR